MQIIQGNIWAAPLPVLIVITTNADVKANGELIMGAGIALEARNKIPTLPLECGKIVLDKGAMYGFQIIRHPRTQGKAGLGIFQTKLGWTANSDVNLIENSAGMLREYAQYNADVPIRLNYPGIGLGRLKKEFVLPILEKYFSDLENIKVYYV